MKKLIVLSLLFSSATFANSVDLNRMADQASKIRKYEGELYLKNKQLAESSKSIDKLHNQYATMYENYRKLAGEKQFLKYQNYRLVQEIESSGEYSGKLVQKVKAYKGRLPASTTEK